MKELTKLRGAIVGLGSIGQRHCRNLERLGAAPPVVVRRAERRNPAFAPPPGALVATSDAEAIAVGIDFAVICNPTRFHVAAARQYLAAGVPVLVEKPISDREEDARQLVEESRRCGTIGCMAYCMRHHSAYAAAREAIRAGVVGRMLYAKAWFESYLPVLASLGGLWAVVCCEKGPWRRGPAHPRP